MSDTSSFLPKAAESLQKQLSSELEITEVASPPTSEYEDLVQWLTPYITRLLDHHFEKLLQLLYRVDVSENLFKEAIGQSNSDHIASSIARLIIDRQIQKMQIRAKYSHF